MSFAVLNKAVIKKFGKDCILPDKSVVRGIFDDPSAMGKLEKIKMGYDQPVLSVLDADAAKLEYKMEIVISGKSYRVQKKLPDGEGITDVLLVEKETSQGEWK